MEDEAPLEPNGTQECCLYRCFACFRRIWNWICNFFRRLCFCCFSSDKQTENKNDGMDNSEKSDGTDSIEAKLKEIERRFSGALSSFQRAHASQTRMAHQTGVLEGARHAAKSLQRSELHTVEGIKGKCFIYEESLGATLAMALKSAYEDLNERLAVTSVTNLDEMISQLDDYHFLLVHFVSPVDEETEKRILEEIQGKHQGVARFVMTQRNFLSEDEEIPKVENAFVLRTDNPGYTEKFIQVLNKHGADFDLEGLIVLTNNELKEEKEQIHYENRLRVKVYLTE